MKPLARLYLTRQKLYDKDCDYTTNVLGQSSLTGQSSSSQECDTDDWSEWSMCSATCGEGTQFRTRNYINEDDREKCNRKLIEYRLCEAFMRTCPESGYLDENDTACELSPWSAWSSCSAACGKGTKTRSRKYNSPEHKRACEARPVTPSLQENEECYNGGEECTEFVQKRVCDYLFYMNSS